MPRFMGQDAAVNGRRRRWKRPRLSHTTISSANSSNNQSTESKNYTIRSPSENTDRHSVHQDCDSRQLDSRDQLRPSSVTPLCSDSVHRRSSCTVVGDAEAKDVHLDLSSSRDDDAPVLVSRLPLEKDDVRRFSGGCERSNNAVHSMTASSQDSINGCPGACATKKTVLELSRDLNFKFQYVNLHPNLQNTEEDAFGYIMTLEDLINDCGILEKGPPSEAVVVFLLIQWIQLAQSHPGWVLADAGNFAAMILLRYEQPNNGVEGTCPWRLLYSSTATLEHVPHDDEYNRRLSTMMINFVALLLLGIEVEKGTSISYLNTIICANRYVRHKKMWSVALEAAMNGQMDRALDVLKDEWGDRATLVTSYLDSLTHSPLREASMSVTSPCSWLPEPKVLFESFDRDKVSIQVLESKLQQAKLMVSKYEELLRLSRDHRSAPDSEDHTMSTSIHLNHGNSLHVDSTNRTTEPKPTDNPHPDTNTSLTQSSSESISNNGMVNNSIMNPSICNSSTDLLTSVSNPIRYGNIVITVDDDSDDDVW